jgi:hypothetical protein
MSQQQSNTLPRAKMIGGDEYDALHRGSRKLICGFKRSKTVSKIKRKFRKRERRLLGIYLNKETLYHV